MDPQSSPSPIVPSRIWISHHRVHSGNEARIWIRNLRPHISSHPIYGSGISALIQDLRPYMDPESTPSYIVPSNIWIRNLRPHNTIPSNIWIRNLRPRISFHPVYGLSSTYKRNRRLYYIPVRENEISPGNDRKAKVSLLAIISPVIMRGRLTTPEIIILIDPSSPSRRSARNGPIRERENDEAMVNYRR